MREKKQGTPLEDLQAAIENLETFAKLNEGESVPNILDLEVHNDQIIKHPKSKLLKSIDLTYRFFSKFVGPADKRFKEKRAKVQQTLLNSIEFLKNHYRLIGKLQQGSTTDQELASSALKAINRYNTLVQALKENPKNLRKRAARFVYEQTGVSVDKELGEHLILLPHSYSIQIGTHSEDQQSTLLKIALLTAPMKHTALCSEASKQEIDALHMKAITLLKNPGFPSSLRTALGALLKETPVRAVMAAAASIPAAGDSAEIILLQQTVSPIPGEEITVQGSFKRNSGLHVPSVPIPNSFQVSTKAFQTGFPHPLQHTGWSLANELIPECPSRLSMLPIFQEVYEKKLLFAKELLPGGQLNDRAKQILKIKKQIIENDSKYYLARYEDLMRAILQAASHAVVTEEAAFPKLERFFNHLQIQAKPLEYFSHTCHLMNAVFLSFPFDRFHELYMDNKQHRFAKESKALYQQCLDILEAGCQEALQECGRQLENNIGEEAAIEFVVSMGTILGDAGKKVILQYISEKLGFSPPLLTNFERIVQICAFKHLLAFQKELLMPASSDMELEGALEKSLKKNLHEEIQLFNSAIIESDLAVKISNELEMYYNSRYFYLIQQNKQQEGS